MKKILSILLCSLLIVPLSGCSNKLIEAYPKIKEDFNEKDYDKLAELSDECSLSYDELKEKFATELTSDFKSKIEDNDLGTVILDEISSNEDATTIKYTIEKEMQFGNTSANIDFEFDSENNINNITYKGDKYVYDDEFINIIEEKDLDDNLGKNIMRSMERGINHDNKVYNESEKFYYIHQDDDSIKIFSNLDDVPKEYVSIYEYGENMQRETEEDMQELRDNIKNVEEAFGIMDDAMRESNH